MCVHCLHLEQWTHTHTHTHLKQWTHTHLEQWAVDTAAPVSSRGFCALLKGLNSVVDNSCRSWDSNPQPRVKRPTLYPLEPRLPLKWECMISTDFCVASNDEKRVIGWFHPSCWIVFLYTFGEKAAAVNQRINRRCFSECEKEKPRCCPKCWILLPEHLTNPPQETQWGTSGTPLLLLGRLAGSAHTHICSFI